MKKIIAIISCIAVLSAVCVLSAFAYERTEEISLETLEISEKENRTEENNVIKSTDNIEINVKYNYTSLSYSLSSSANDNSSGIYNGQAYDGNFHMVNVSDYSFSSITIYSNFMRLSNANSGDDIFIGYYQSNEINGNIVFTVIPTNITIKNYFLYTLTIDEMSIVYDDSENFLAFITDTLTDLVDYMITNNLILIVMAIVIVSFGISVLVRITKVK